MIPVEDSQRILLNNPNPQKRGPPYTLVQDTGSQVLEDSKEAPKEKNEEIIQ